MYGSIDKNLINKKVKKIAKKLLTNKTACYILIIVAAVKQSVITEATMRGCSSMVEHQPSKLDTWVRFPSPAYAIVA